MKRASLKLTELGDIIINRIEHFFTAHCAECEAAKKCKQCAQYELMLEQERNERMQLLHMLSMPQSTEASPEPDWSNISRPKSWNQIRTELETKARKEYEEQVRKNA